ncbi:MAG: KH domain-containing protein [Cellulosilyticaceae bacterium]
MKDLVEVIAKELVDCPEEVFVSQKEDDHTVTIELKVSQDDMGKIIGKQGKIAKAIRTVVKSAAASSHKKVVVEIMQ